MARPTLGSTTIVALPNAVVSCSQQYRRNAGASRLWSFLLFLRQVSLKTEPFLALFRKKLSRSSQVNVERRWDCFAPALSLQTLQLVHGAIELPVQVSFVAEKFVRCIRGRQAETSSLRVSHELLALCRVSLKRAKGSRNNNSTVLA